MSWLELLRIYEDIQGVKLHIKFGSKADLMLDIILQDIEEHLIKMSRRLTLP